MDRARQESPEGDRDTPGVSEAFQGGGVLGIFSAPASRGLLLKSDGAERVLGYCSEDPVMPRRGSGCGGVRLRR